MIMKLNDISDLNFFIFYFHFFSPIESNLNSEKIFNIPDPDVLEHMKRSA